jgi:hypothetical protein
MGCRVLILYYISGYQAPHWIDFNLRPLEEVRPKGQGPATRIIDDSARYAHTPGNLVYLLCLIVIVVSRHRH